MKKVLYYAVSGRGQACVFTSEPVRDERRKIWLGEIDGLYCRLLWQLEVEGLELPVMRWSDDPVMITISVEI